MIRAFWFVQVKISSTVWRDWETGEEHDFSDVNCATFYYDPSDATAPQLLSFSGCLIGGGGGDTLGTTRNETVTAGCKNALASVCYTVRLEMKSYHRTRIMLVVVVVLVMVRGDESCFLSCCSSAEC